MWRLLFLCAIAQVVHCSCPSGFELVQNECRGSYFKLPHEYFNNITDLAVAKCNEILGQPFIIHNDEEQSYWSARAYPLPTNGDPMLILGLSCNSATKKWQWADGSPLDYKPSKYSDNLDSACDPNMSFYLASSGEWLIWNSPTFVADCDISCTVQSHQPVPYPDGCDSFQDDSEDGVCYQVGATAENWQDAQMICKMLGANLASIHNLQENSFIRRLAVSKGAVNGLFLGATISGKGKDFGWVDGSEWNYQNFYPGFPHPGIGDCLAMDTTTSAGQWMNTDCSSKLPVACIRDQREITEPTCNPAFSEGTVMTSPGFPFNASTPCDYFLEVDEGQSVEVEIYLEANPCCDFLVLHDGFLGGNMIANLTGELRNVTYTSASNLMRVSWQPDGDVNVRGLAMTYRGV